MWHNEFLIIYRIKGNFTLNDNIFKLKTGMQPNLHYLSKWNDYTA